MADELHMIFECPALRAVRQRYAPLFSTDTNTMSSFFAQQDHMQVFKFVLDCLDVFHFDLRLLLYVIRLAGWLKHCNLSLSLPGTFNPLYSSHLLTRNECFAAPRLTLLSLTAGVTH